jgi:hypothetical protein
METNTYSDRRWRIFDANFKELCVMVDKGRNVRTTCKGLGAMDGKFTNLDGGRKRLAVRNDRADMLILTQRTPEFTKKAFGK